MIPPCLAMPVPVARPARAAAAAAKDNHRSIRLCEALGARPDGTHDGCRIYRHTRPEFSA